MNYYSVAKDCSKQQNIAGCCPRAGEGVIFCGQEWEPLSFQLNEKESTTGCTLQFGSGSVQVCFKKCTDVHTMHIRLDRSKS